MNRIASLPKQFIDSLNERDEVKMKELINRNFDLRREIWGVEALGGEEGMNMKMIQVKKSRLIINRLQENMVWLQSSVVLVVQLVI